MLRTDYIRVRLPGHPGRRVAPTSLPDCKGPGPFAQFRRAGGVNLLKKVSEDSPDEGWSRPWRVLWSTSFPIGRNALDRRKRPTNRGRCEHATFPVKVLPAGGGKKIAYCLGCGRSSPVAEGSMEALAALREASHPVFQQS